MEKLEVTAKQRANAVEALTVMWPSVPPENVVEDLGMWRANGRRDRRPDCGTVACFGGWCAWWPAFQAQGVKADGNGSPTLRNEWAWSCDVSERLFGDDDLFNSRETWERGTDHEVVAKRLRKLIRESVVV